MLTILDTADDVIAAVISDAITGTDLDALMDRLEASMSRHDRVHMFVETRNLQALDVAALPAHVARAMPLFGKLRHFGRVAVVADQAWMRWGTRIERPGVMDLVEVADAVAAFERFVADHPARQAGASPAP